MPKNHPLFFWVSILFEKVIPTLVLSFFLLFFFATLTVRFSLGITSFFLTQIGPYLLPILGWYLYERFQKHHDQKNQELSTIKVLSSHFAISKRLFLGGLLFGLALFMFSLFVAQPIFEKWYPPSEEEKNQWLTFLKLDKRPLMINLLCFALLPAVCEESFFRGLLFSLFQKSSSATMQNSEEQCQAKQKEERILLITTWLFTSIIFGFSHFSLAKLLPTTLLGLGFGFARLRSGSLWPAMMMHCLHNGMILVLAVYHPQNLEVSFSIRLCMFFVSCVLGGMGIYLLRPQNPPFIHTGEEI